MAIRPFLSRLAARLRRRDRHPSVIHRVALRCPHGDGLVEVDVLMSPTGMPQKVVRCSAHRQDPPTCDQACRAVHEVFAAQHMLVILPPGTEVPDEVD